MIFPKDIRPLFLGLTCLVWIGGLSSCRTYTEKTHVAMNHFQRGQFDVAERLFSDKSVTGSTFLSGVEAGMVALTAGDHQAAIDHFAKAASISKELEDKGLLDPSSLAQSLTSLAVSETFTDYQGEGFERVMLHACMGLAYLAQGKVDDWMVEVRLANDLLILEETLYETEYAAGGLGHFLSALGYELRGELDEAYIDLQVLYDKGLGQELVGPSLVRLSKQLYREDDHARFVAEFGEVEEVPRDAAKIVLLAGVGMGPSKVETRLDVPTSNGVFSWAVPSFTSTASYVDRLEVRANDLFASSVVIENVAQVAEKNLSDRMAYLSVRSAVRGVLKQKLARELRKEHGEGAYVVAQLFAMATERADLRSWLTLPNTWQAARLYPRPGEVRLEIHASGGESHFLGNYDMDPGETIYLLVRTIGPRVFTQVLGGRRVDQPEAPAVPLESETARNPISTP